jgi:hypothetical protein
MRKVRIFSSSKLFKVGVINISTSSLLIQSTESQIRHDSTPTENLKT